jgi:hypothetical protein
VSWSGRAQSGQQCDKRYKHHQRHKRGKRIRKLS